MQIKICALQTVCLMNTNGTDTRDNCQVTILIEILIKLAIVTCVYAKHYKFMSFEDSRFVFILLNIHWFWFWDFFAEKKNLFIYLCCL